MRTWIQKHSRLVKNRYCSLLHYKLELLDERQALDVAVVAGGGHGATTTIRFTRTTAGRLVGQDELEHDEVVHG